MLISPWIDHFHGNHGAGLTVVNNGRRSDIRTRGPVCPREKSAPATLPTKTQLRLYASLAPRNGVNGVKFRGGVSPVEILFNPPPSPPPPRSDDLSWKCEMNDRPKLDSPVFPHAEISLTNPPSIRVPVIFFIPPFPFPLPPLLPSPLLFDAGIRFFELGFLYEDSFRTCRACFEF